MTRWARAAWWVLPPALTLAFYWKTLDIWFRADDFAWLSLARSFQSWRQLPELLFTPMAQGTIRPLSERGYFLALYQLFGPDPLPFHVAALCAQLAAGLLLAAVVLRMTGSRLAGFLAPVLWTFSAGPGIALSWISAFNQILLALALLAALWCWIRYCETAQAKFLAGTWVCFLTGFGVQEANVVFPALALAYSILFARSRWRAAAPMFAVSAAYVILHFRVAPKASQGVYALYFDRDLPATLAAYWGWAMGIARYPEYFGWPRPEWATAGVWLLTAAWLALVTWSLRLRNFAPAFFLVWFLVVLGPVLPLKLHQTDYYLAAPAAGLAAAVAALAGFAWRRRRSLAVSALALAAASAAVHIPIIRAQINWYHNQSKEVAKLVLGSVAAAKIHPGKLILFAGVSDSLFHNAFYDRAFQVFGVEALIAPGGVSKRILDSGLEDLAEFLMPEAAARAALENGLAVVYDAGRPKLTNVTAFFRLGVSRNWSTETPSRIEPARAGFGAFLGPGWLDAVGDLRWMGSSAVVYLHPPERGEARLRLWVYCEPEHLAGGALPVKVLVNGKLLGERHVTRSKRIQRLDLWTAVPMPAAGRMEVEIQSGRTIRLPNNHEPVGLAVRAVEIQQLKP